MTIDYTLIRSNRKTVALCIRDGKLVVRAPLNTPVGQINKFIWRKSRWIEQKLAATGERAAIRESFALTYGSAVEYRGERYAIEAREGGRAGFDGECFYVPPDMPPERIKAACVEIYRKLARRVLAGKALEYAKAMYAFPAKISVTGAKKRWGSCSKCGRVNFSWRLMMADDDLIDYVVVHELAHLSEMNHSDRFWAKVAWILPDWPARRQRLKELQRRLAYEDWDV